MSAADKIRKKQVERVLGFLHPQLHIQHMPSTQVLHALDNYAKQYQNLSRLQLLELYQALKRGEDDIVRTLSQQLSQKEAYAFAHLLDSYLGERFLHIYAG